MFIVRVLALALVVVLLVGCVPVGFTTTLTGSGHTVTKEFDLAGFTKVSAGSAFEVEISQGDGYSVVITVDDNLVDQLDVTKSGDTLRVQMKPSLSLRNTTMRAKVMLPVLTGLDLSGASRTTVTGFSSGKPLAVQVSGASTLRGDIKCGDARFDVSGASKAELQGGADGLAVKASGASTATLDAFPSKNTTVDASGASHVSVNVSGTLTAQASGASSVTYAGEPTKVNMNTSGASSVHQK
jgi:hypothetical protein